MGIVFGLLAAVFWGVGDYVVTTLARAVGTAKSLLYIQAFSLLAWLILILFMPHAVAAATSVWMLALAAGLFHVGGLVLTYRAFEIGTLSFVSPIASSFAVVTALLAISTGRPMSIFAMSGTALLILGVAVITRSTPAAGNTTLRGIPEAIGSAICFGVMFWMVDRYVYQPLGYVLPLIVLKPMATGYAVVAVSISKEPEPESKPRPTTLIRLAFCAAALDTLAWVAWLRGNQEVNTAIVTALSSLFSAVTVVMACIFLKERLNRSQWIAVGIILAGILFVSLPS